MSKPKVYAAVPIPCEAEELISKYCYLEKWESDKAISQEELIKNLGDKDGLIITGGVSLNSEIINSAPNLKVVSSISVGYNNFDLPSMKERNIIGTNTPNVLDDTVADLTFGLILSAARRISELDRYVRDGKWLGGNDRPLFGTDVHHSTLGIIGMGRIGEVIAKRASLGFDMNVLYHNRSRKLDAEERLGVKYSCLEDLLKQSDFVVVMTPYTKDTHHLMDYEQFNLMKNAAFFINTSRGQTVNEEALIEALSNKKIAGAGLDVFEKEPVGHDNPLLKMENVVVLPHIGSATAKTRLDMAMCAARSMVEGLTGGMPSTVVPELRK